MAGLGHRHFHGKPKFVIMRDPFSWKQKLELPSRPCNFGAGNTMKRRPFLLAGVALTTLLTFPVVGTRAGDASSEDNPATALRHRYSFATDASDAIGHADGALEGAATISGGQVHLNGTRGTYVNLPGGLIAGYQAVTFEFWATLGVNKSWPRVFDQGATNGNLGGHDLYFCPHSGQKDFRLTIMDPDPTERRVTLPGNLDHQTNLYVACVLDSVSGFMGVYTNGVLAASRQDLTSLASVATNYFFLGRSLFASDAPLNGSIDEFRIYNAALSPAAIAASYGNGPDAVIPAR
jgi:hypothetical protein